MRLFEQGGDSGRRSAAVGARGHPRRRPPPFPSHSASGGDLATGAFARVLGGETGYRPATYLTNEDVGFEGLAPDGVAGWLDDDGATECAWAFASDGQTYATDATRDALVVVGWFVNSDLTVYDQQGDLVTVLDRVDGSPSQDAFALRFGWPDER